MTTTIPSVRLFAEAEGPIRGELFSAERLEQHAESLASAQVTSEDVESGRPLIPRVLENGRILLEYYRATASAIQQGSSITPAAEWLVDNFYIVEEQLREIRDDLPRGYYRRLPKLASGHLQGYPRVFGVAWAYVAHTDSRFEPDLLRRFVNAYQRVQPLTTGELWALAITLRVVLVENLRKLSDSIVRSRRAREEADRLVDSLLGNTDLPSISPMILRRFEDQPLERAFAVQLFQRLRDSDPRVGPILLWLDKRLDAQGTTPDEIVRAEHQDQTAMTVTVRNVIISMRLMTAFDWHDFFESVSLVDEVLRSGSLFAEMDFSTRDYYRHAIEELSRGSNRPEIEIAERALQHARQARAKNNGNAPNHLSHLNHAEDPGYYLVSKGRVEFERELGFRAPRRQKLLRLYVQTALPGYLGTILVLTCLILALPLLPSWEHGVARFYLILLGLVGAIPASDLAIALCNRGVTSLLGPRALPRLELKDGVPEHLRTIVVVPTLFTGLDAVREHVERLEIHYLANPEGELCFALLSDWVDALSETMQGDEELLAAAAQGIDALNQRHGPAPGGNQRFFLFHRKRVWNESERKWMGWERKRGKLHELNLLLRGRTGTTFIPTGGRPPEKIPGVRYVITLDADTRVPRGAVARLVGTMAHPLNQPEFSARAGRIVDGYSIAQPRITPTLPANRDGSLFQRIFSGPSGMDPYAFAVSDVYQDLFGEGSFTGKGIYDIDAFEQALDSKVRENTLLSHDLLEGIFARAALASDIELFEEFPSHYTVAASRQHRWARGDWQLLPWLFGKGTGSGSKSGHFTIPLISRWKMLDNLRRTLSSPALFLTLVLSWLIPGVSPLIWTGFAILTISIPPLMPFFAGLRPLRVDTSRRSHLRSVFADLSLAFSQIVLTITCLAYQAWLMADAILRTLVRMFITRRNLLEWVTAAQAKHAADLEISGIFKQMIGGVMLAFAALAVVVYRWPHAAPLALPFIMLWITAPVFALRISQPPRLTEIEPLTSADAQRLRLISRRTWHFFETFVTSEDNWLPPDNFQEDPKPVVAHRTSPTNIGLYLLSAVAARDFGWLGTLETMERAQATLGTLKKMELFRGHFYNWYETQNLRPLEPKYISSVDSGNLAGDLIVLGNACREFLQKPVLDGRTFAGLEDTTLILREILAGGQDTRASHTVAGKQLSNAVDSFFIPLHASAPSDAVEWASLFGELKERARTIDDISQALSQEHADPQTSELRVWAAAVRACVESHARDMELVNPWARLKPTQVSELVEFLACHSPESTDLYRDIQKAPTLEDASKFFETIRSGLSVLREQLLRESSAGTNFVAHVDALSAAVSRCATDCDALAQKLLDVAQTAETMFSAMEFKFLYDSMKRLFSIGFRIADGSLDTSFYDLLASEARLTSFIAIAKEDVPTSHWFRLGRSMTPVARGSALISWSGSMFEYLMPALVMRSPEGSMLSQTYREVVRRQMDYGEERNVPWGISESAFNARDLMLTYQYSAFGVPGLGLKRGLSEDTVISPYSTALAAMIFPPAAMQNFKRLADAGGEGRYGFYEALDYTKIRLPEGQDVAVIHAYMAHHQGMSLVALANVLNDGVMRSRFHADPIVQATELLLQERTPRDALAARPRAEEVSASAKVRDLVAPVARRFTSLDDSTPRTQLLSNGNYSVMLTAAGSGYSRWRDIAITRWRDDGTRDCWGTYFYLRDMQAQSMWSAGFQPTGVESDAYEAEFYEDHAEFFRRDRNLNTKLEVVVSSEEDAEVRRISITNLGSRSRDIQVTSCAELSLISQAADLSHPAFANLFVETEYVSELGALLATRRKRSPDEPSVWVAHVLFVNGETVGDLEYETDRARLLGRGHSVRKPVSIADGRKLSNTVGSVLDPAFSLRRTVRVAPGGTAHLVFTTIAAETREQVLDLADRYRNAWVFERTLALAWTHAQVQLHHLGIGPDEAHLFQRLANAVIYPEASLRASSDQLARTDLEISTLWSLGISGDLPIVLAVIDNEDDVETIRQLLRAHEYWRMKQLSADLVIVNDKPPSYNQDFQGSLETLVHASQLRLSPDSGNTRGRIFLVRGDLISPQTRAQIQTFARVLILSRRGTLSEQIGRPQPISLPRETATVYPWRRTRAVAQPDAPLPLLNLEFFNGIGGFDKNGREYVTVLAEGLRTPEPWVNVVANPAFGFLVSESGSSFTWSENSHENQITPWSNEHLADHSGEVIYIRDEATGEVWCPTALPIRDETAVYIARHGQGYSRFQHESHGIALDLLEFVPLADPIKIVRLTLTNNSGRPRRLSVTAYVEWVLGSSRTTSAPFVVTEIDPGTGAMFARSALQGEFAGRIAFADLAGKQIHYTADRAEFLGHNGTLRHPLGLELGPTLSGRVGAGLDPCAALQAPIELRAGATAEVLFFLGETESREQVRELLRQYRTKNLDQVLLDVTTYWDEICGGVQIATPDKAMDLLFNRWLLYQTLSCRIWARAGFYQLSGAYGFRDQLQDVMALMTARREIAREQLLRAASRQFIAGDVQHWWHPPAGRGVRTRISDDRLWLPYAAIQFIEATGDAGVLNEAVPFLDGEELTNEQKETYFQPNQSSERASLFEHCARALDCSLGVGSHGLPLMGTGDWNDGMNRVGEGGRGESVWLGWFLHTILWEFAKIADARGEYHRAETWRLHVSALKAALEREGWDGAWYRRAFFDDGTPLGSAANTECRIDAIAQSWGVISGAAEPGRAARAMVAVSQQLIREADGLVLLLTPPFNHSSLDPGYIQGYVPGIRENGGQYTHAAVWTLIAFAALGDGDKAGDLLRMLNPIHRSSSRAGVQRYKVEPYVMAGDVYAEAPHAGRGGWTWYTGSSGWFYRAGVEWMLGFRVRGNILSVDPCISRSWPSYSMQFRYHSASYNIRVENPKGVCRGVARVEFDGKSVPGPANIPLSDDGIEHQVLVVLG
jgi:cyclic beta-1,2-glucan synthetase